MAEPTVRQFAMVQRWVEARRGAAARKEGGGARPV
jgi:hypothetical protein